MKNKFRFLTLLLTGIMIVSMTGCYKREMTEEEKYHPEETEDIKEETSEEVVLEFKKDRVGRNGYYCLDGNFTWEGSPFSYTAPYFYDKDFEYCIDGYVIESYKAETRELFKYEKGTVIDLGKLVDENPDLQGLYIFVAEDKYGINAEGSFKDTILTATGSDSLDVSYNEARAIGGAYFIASNDPEWTTFEKELEKSREIYSGFEYVYTSWIHGIGLSEEAKEEYKETEVAKEIKKVTSEYTINEVLDKIDNWNNLSENEKIAISVFLLEDSHTTGYVLYRENDNALVTAQDYFVKDYGWDFYLEEADKRASKYIQEVEEKYLSEN